MKKPIQWLLRIAKVLAVVGVVGGVAFLMWPVSFFHEFSYLDMLFSGVESHSVTVAGHRMHYYVAGPEEGTPVVLVHGLGGRAEDWKNLESYFVRWGFRVYLPDLPGFGHSERPADFSYSIPDQADAVVAFMDAVGLQQVELGGWSMGGWVVQRVAIKHPERVRKLMLFDSAGLYVKPDWDTRLFTPQTSAELDKLDALLMPNPPKVPGFVARDILRVSKQNAWVIHRALDSMLTGHDATDNQLPMLKMPVLILWGTEDHITPISEGYRMSKLIPQSQIMVFPGCGHLAPTQCADKMGLLVTEFAQE